MNTVAVNVREPTDVAEARRKGQSAAELSGLPAERLGAVAISVSELATNVLRHGGGGEVLFTAHDGCLEVIALDRGPGMANVRASLTDGVSTGGTRGEGLGAVLRAADHLDIFSQVGAGSAILARFGQSEVAWSGVNVPYPGETVCGDAWSVVRRGDCIDVMVADGLGHGLMASEAAQAAVEAFAKRGHLPPADFLSFAQGALRPTRGAAVAMARLRPAKVEFAGVGNIAGSVMSDGKLRKMISHNGTLGHVAKHFQAFEYAAPPPSVVILHSDGLGSSWNLDRYPGLVAADPALIAGVLYRDFTRGRDDVTVVAARGL